MRTSSNNYLKQQLQMTVLYDGWCPICQKSAATGKKLDFFHLIEFVSFREPGVTEKYGLDPDALEKRMHTTADGNKFCTGIDGIIQMFTRLLPFWPLLPFLVIVRRVGLGQAIYDFIAKRRSIIPTGGCDDSCPIPDRRKG